ncbi:hypothetical protein QZK27_03085 [Acinetobacter baumannii]|uniref:hypothetical protein n=1 Tax=Acinetobacter TaxID=469 RepID=UPI00056EAD6B|nr:MULTISPECIES: hypothetical protein [Acinetobacter]HAV4234139.1 hypothetical protein [Acinetobacter baumannii ATCC 17978]MCE6084361.1 hypothetical protein [Acinetobacter baumannii]MCZ3190728.1 hypothetical protein [Acinetobacter baumannii]MCZ3342357.1 hypothetical protein [Acinetobacter baumannii]MDA3590160.1 hypothetical protein [Acinetobacter sp. AOR01_HL]
MTDLNKLRSEFEAVTDIYHCIYNADLDYYFSGSKFASDKAEIEVNAGWKSWKKAKAQAVPEGYVLLPRVPTEKMFQAYERYSVAPMSTLSKTGYKAMVEAAGDQNENS